MRSVCNISQSQSGGLNLTSVVRLLSGRDASLRRVYASHGVPMEASTDGRSEKFEIRVATATVSMGEVRLVI